MHRLPWTREELRALIPVLDDNLRRMEREQAEEVRPLPPMTSDEARDLILQLVDVAGYRPLSQRELFLHGQLLRQFKQACWAEARGHKGRCYVIPEETLQQMLDAHRAGKPPEDPR